MAYLEDPDPMVKKTSQATEFVNNVGSSAIGNDTDTAFNIEDSIYPEVRASVQPYDEDLIVSTFRTWSLGFFWTIILAGINQFFGMHSPTLGLSAGLVIIIVLPMGNALAKVLPTRQWSIIPGHSFTLNPGPFNRKEHTVICIMAIAVSYYDSGAIASRVWTALIKYFDMDISVAYRFMFVFTTQATCIGLAGMFQAILVEPSYCVWPSALPTCSLLEGMHNKNFQEFVANGWKTSRMRFFWIVLGCATMYQILPGYLFTGLSTFAWVCWIAPNNVTLNHIFGAETGMDLLPLTLDWNQVTAYMGSPLIVPSFAIVNTMIGTILFVWIISPILHWSNVWWGKYMPFSSSSIFDNTGSSYNISRVITSDYQLNDEAYHSYSPVFMSTTSVLSYGLGLGVMTSLITHSALFHGKEIVDGLRRTFSRAEINDGDIHVKLMKKYKRVPFWWYSAYFAIMIALSMFFVEYFDTGLPWWGILVSILINVVVFIPIGIMSAICNISASTNIIGVLVGGYIWAGDMVAVVIFKIFTFNTTGTGMVILRDMKLGNYMKIPPRIVFTAQVLGMLVNCCVQVVVNAWALDNVDGICTSSATGNLTCPVSRAYKASITFWGLIGPEKLFATGAMYNAMLYFFLIGGIAPILVWLAARKWPGSWFEKIHIPVIMSSTGAVPPATAINYFPWGIIGLTFQLYIRRCFSKWWSKYNYLLSGALDGALALASFLIFFCLYYPGVEFSWWGNTVASTTADSLGTPLMTVTQGFTFGPKSWK